MTSVAASASRRHSFSFCTDYDVVSVTTRWLVGRIFKTHSPQGDRWQWALTGDTVMPECPSLGFAATKDEAKRDLAATRRGDT